MKWLFILSSETFFAAVVCVRLPWERKKFVYKFMFCLHRKCFSGRKLDYLSNAMFIRYRLMFVHACLFTQRVLVYQKGLRLFKIEQTVNAIIRIYENIASRFVSSHRQPLRNINKRLNWLAWWNNTKGTKCIDLFSLATALASKEISSKSSFENKSTAANCFISDNAVHTQNNINKISNDMCFKRLDLPLVQDSREHTPQWFWCGRKCFLC